MVSLLQTSTYNTLPSLEDAEIRLREGSFESVLNGPLRDVFIKHGHQGAFCIYLQHAHNILREDEAIVKVGGTGHVMNHEIIARMQSYGNRIVPTTWMTTATDLQPMELSLLDERESVPKPSAVFMADILQAFRENGCLGLFGIDTIYEYDCVEMTIGEASVVIPSNGKVFEGFIPVAFVFEDDEPKYRVHKACKQNVRHTSKAAPRPPQTH